MIDKYYATLPERWRPIFAGGVSLLAGALVALVLHYVLYRINMPSTPFIYVAF
jgi:hypothetical protein